MPVHKGYSVCTHHFFKFIWIIYSFSNESLCLGVCFSVCLNDWWSELRVKVDDLFLCVCLCVCWRTESSAIFRTSKLSHRKPLNPVCKVQPECQSVCMCACVHVCMCCVLVILHPTPFPCVYCPCACWRFFLNWINVQEWTIRRSFFLLIFQNIIHANICPHPKINIHILKLHVTNLLYLILVIPCPNSRVNSIELMRFSFVFFSLCHYKTSLLLYMCMRWRSHKIILLLGSTLQLLWQVPLAQ